MNNEVCFRLVDKPNGYGLPAAYHKLKELQDEKLQNNEYLDALDLEDCHKSPDSGCPHCEMIFDLCIRNHQLQRQIDGILGSEDILRCDYCCGTIYYDSEYTTEKSGKIICEYCDRSKDASSASYPLGGMLEPHDIARDKAL